MPTTVKAHRSHSSTGKVEHVRKFVRTGPEHSAKWKRLVADLTEQRHVDDPYAVATAVLGLESYTPSERRKITRYNNKHPWEGY